MNESSTQSLASVDRIIDYPEAGTAEFGSSWTSPPITEEVLRSGIIPADRLVEIGIKPRENLCGTWFCEGDLGFIFGERGLGKTWLSLELGRGLAEGRAVGPWPVAKSRRVLYVDGEMPLDGMRDRNLALSEHPGPLMVLSHQWLFEKTGCVLNLTDRKIQSGLLSVCRSEGIEVLIIDNLSCLFSGMPENEADAWEYVLPWLLQLRRCKIAVVIVHHANRSGMHMRGTSRREDAAFWVLRLDAVPEHAKECEGARFVSRFVKARQGTGEETEPLDWAFTSEGTRTRVTYRPLPTIEVFKQWIRDGLTSCSDIAEEMGLSKGAVSKMAHRGMKDGWLAVEGRTYKLAE